MHAPAARGTTLGTVMLVLSIALTLVLTSASIGIFNLRFSTAVDNRDHARNLAESAIQQALANVTDDNTYGVARTTQSINVTISDLPAGNYGVATFNITQAAAWNCGYSTNNFANGAQAPGFGRDVPHNCVHLVGLGHCGDATAQLEMLFYKPPFPQALASTGTINVSGLVLQAMKAGATYTGSVADQDETPASLYSNSASTPSMSIDSACNIVGDAAAVGTIQVSPGAIISGELRQNQGPAGVPQIDVAGTVNQVSGLQGLGAFSSPLERYCVLTGPVTEGDLVLNGGLLAVNGDLTLNSLSGDGAVVVNGNVIVNGGVTLQADKTAALVASGDIHLNGTGISQYFQGLIYSQGNVYAKDITVLGSMVANGGSDPSKGNLTLTDMTMVQMPVSVQTSFANPILQQFQFSFDVDPGKKDSGGSTTVTEDGTILVQLGSRPLPSNTAQFQYFGYANYQPTTAGGVPVTAYYSPESYDSIFQALTLFAQNVATTYYNQPLSASDLNTFQSFVTNALNALSVPIVPPTVISFNLNNVLNPAETNRIVLFREISP